jgi:hypothetical protein
MLPWARLSCRAHACTRVDDEGMLHAYRNPVRVLEFDDLTMLIGADRAGRLIEVGTVGAEGIVERPHHALSPCAGPYRRAAQ